MTGKTHMAAGAAAAIGLYTLTTKTIYIPHILLYTGLGMLGGLLPDIDHPNSKISHQLKPVSKVVTLFCKHRGFMHAPALYLILWALLMTLCPPGPVQVWASYILVGAASHLLLDFLNPGGIPIFFPIEKKHQHLLSIKTGGILENVLAWTLLGGYIAAFYRLFLMLILTP